MPVFQIQDPWISEISDFPAINYRLKYFKTADVCKSGNFGLRHRQSILSISGSKKSCYTDLYSMGIRKNKDRGSRLHKVSDDVSLCIPKATRIVAAKNADTICCVPDCRSSESKGRLLGLKEYHVVFAVISYASGTRYHNTHFLTQMK